MFTKLIKFVGSVVVYGLIRDITREGIKVAHKKVQEARAKAEAEVADKKNQHDPARFN